MRLAVVPRPAEFYSLFAAVGENAVEAARLVDLRVQNFPEGDISQTQVKDVESRGDELTRQIIRLLNTQYVTPFDREDIYELARAVDDIVDHIEHASDLLTLYRVEAPMEQAKAQCRVLVAATESLARALSLLRRPAKTQEHLAVVKQHEDEGDRIVRDAIAALFEDEGVNPLSVIRWKDIFEALEEAVDACETASHVIGNIAVKNA
jgi:predicted phosphate transport protein (TIGR00153 family)